MDIASALLVPVSSSCREKQTQALRGRNLTRNIPDSGAPTVHQALAS